tara:strand:+ start:476 stop:1372 length:897 start_codon:yes stop_codon:yes gene_type:complete
MNSLVSVIVPTYKRSSYILRAINSILNQTYKNIEIIVIDDNEADDEFSKITQNVLKRLIDSKKIIYIKHVTNKGISAARNTGIKKAKGDYIAFLDDDDEFLPKKIELQLDIFNKSKNNVGLVYGAYLEINENLNKELVIIPKLKDNVYSILGLNHIGPPSMVMCTKSAIEQIGGFDEFLNHKEDIDFYFRLSEKYNISFTNEVITKYYIHSGAASKNHSDRLILMLRYLDKHKEKMKEPKIRWSELQERLGELNAINNYKKKAISAFFLAYINRPLRLRILIKIFLLILGIKKFSNKQ